MKLDRAYGILLVCWFTWFWSQSVNGIITALFPAIQESLSLSTTEISYMITATSLGSMFSYLGSGFITARLGARKVILLGLTVSVACLQMISLSFDYLFILITRSVLGFSVGLYLPAGLSILFDLFTPEKRGRYVGIHEMAAPAGMTLGPIIAGAMLTWGFNWNGALQVWVIPTIIVLVLQLLFVREKKKAQTREDGQSSESVKISGTRTWPIKNILLLVLAQVLRGVASMGMNLMPVFWVSEYGVAVGYAAFIFGIVKVFAIFGQAGAGYLSDIMGRTKVLYILQFLASIMFIPSFYLPFGPALFISLSVVSILTNGFMPVMFTLMSDTCKSPAERARMVGIVMACYGISGTINPPILGFLADTFSYWIAWIFPIIAGFLAIPVLMLSLKPFKNGTLTISQESKQD